MAINPIYTTRVTHGLKGSSLTTQIQANSLTLFRLQQQLATGRKLLQTADDPVGTGRVVQYQQLLERQDQILTNVRTANAFLSATDDATNDIGDLLTQAAGIASDNVGSLASADQRAAAATIIDGIINQLQIVGNRQFNGRFLFGGRQTDRPPLDAALGRIADLGDDGDLVTRAAAGSAFGFDSDVAYNLPVADLFRLRENNVIGATDLGPVLAADTRLVDVAGARGQGVRLGTIRLTEHAGPSVTFDVDLSDAQTLGEVVARINAAASTAGTSLTTSIVGGHLRVVSGGGNTFDIADIGDGFSAADLGLTTTTGGPTLDGADINARLTLTTPLSALLDGAGLSLPSGITLRNGQRTATVSFAGTTTIQDVLNRLNSSGVGIRAAINAAGTGIDVINLVSGTDLSIGENGGSDATALGIRTLETGTKLAALNHGRGVTTVPGDDLSITDGNGVQFGVDLDGATTIGDVLSRINTAAGLAGSTLTAGFVASGNGIRLSQPSGTQNIVLARANLSPALDDLGFAPAPGTPTEWVGGDVNPVRASGALSALYRLRDGLLGDDTREIAAAGAEISDMQQHVASVRGIIGARTAAIEQRLTRTEDVVAATRVLLSEVRDVDFTEAATKFSQAQTALQANLQAGSRLLDLSLLDFLR